MNEADDEDQVNLFDFLELLAIALGRKQVDARVGAVALYIANTSQRTRGTGAYVPDQRIAAELGIGRRSVWRYVDWLIANKWIEQTAKPTRGAKGRPGRKANYRLLRPTIDLGTRLPDGPVDLAHDSEGIE